MTTCALTLHPGQWKPDLTVQLHKSGPQNPPDQLPCLPQEGGGVYGDLGY